MKVILIGDTKVGKTCILDRMTAGIFNDNVCPTIGAAFKTHTFNTPDGAVSMQIWDTAGQEQFRSLAPMYYRSASMAIIFFDITSRESFASVDQWLNELNEKASPDMPRVIVGNKLDLIDERKVTKDEAEDLARIKNAAFYAETSAKTGDGVVELFTKIANYVQNETKKQQDISGILPMMSFTSSGCC